MRGEKDGRFFSVLLMAGSPPHARGKEERDGMNHGKAGITPACAGKRMLARTISEFPGDHPRMRGEKK